MSDARTPLREESYDNLLRFNPMERVEFSFGMLLDVDEFEIEQAERLLRRRIHQALLHGYGTALGLGVTTRADEAGRDVELVVQSGWAVDPLGRDIWVGEAMCLDLSRLHEHEIWSELSADGDVRTLWVVARWVGLLTSRIPAAHIASCAPADHGLVYSRQRDGARVDLASTPPEPSNLPPDLLADVGTGTTRQRWREAIVRDDALGALLRTWRGPSDAPVLLARVEVRQVDDATEIVRIDDSARPILPAVQSVGEWVAAESLRALNPADWFAVESVDVSSVADELTVRFELTRALHPASLHGAVVASRLQPTDLGWQPLTLDSVTSVASDTAIEVRIDASALAADTFIEVRVRGTHDSLISPAGEALQGTFTQPDSLEVGGADVVIRFAWPLS